MFFRGWRSVCLGTAPEPKVLRTGVAATCAACEHSCKEIFYKMLCRTPFAVRKKKIRGRCWLGHSILGQSKKRNSGQKKRHRDKRKDGIRGRCWLGHSIFSHVQPTSKFWLVRFRTTHPYYDTEVDEVDFTLQRASRTGGSAGGLSIVNVCPSWSASCRRCLMSQMKRLMCMLCGLQGSVVCPLVFCPDKQENKDGREPRRVRGRGCAELRHTTECMRAHNFDDFSSMSPLILSSPQLSNISTRSSVVAMTRNKWWQLCGVGSVTACGR